jgi:hypothetical protein
VDDFENPWDYEVATEALVFSASETQVLLYKHSYTMLTTEAHNFGLFPSETTNKKLTRAPIGRIDKSTLAVSYPYIWIT